MGSKKGGGVSLVLILLCSLFTTNGTSLEVNQNNDDEQVLNVYFPMAIEEYSFFSTQAYITQMVWTSVSAGLYSVDLDTEEVFVPELADGPPIVSEDGLEYTVKLKENLKFSSGSPLTAEDVEFSYNMYLSPDITAFFTYIGLRISAFDDNSSISMIDDYTIKFKFINSNFLNSNFLTWVIVDKDKYLQKYNDCVLYTGEEDDESNPCKWNDSTGDDFESAGPYKIDIFDLDTQVIEVIKNAYYHKDNAWADRIRFHLNIDPSQTENILQAGIADMIDWRLDFNQSAYSNYPTYETFQLQDGSLTVQELALNLNHPYYGTGEAIPDGNGITDNDLIQSSFVRLAISHIIDRNHLISEYYDTTSSIYATPASVSVNPAEPGYNDSLLPHQYNVTKAKQFMENAGFQFSSIIDSNQDGDYGDIGDTTFFNISLLAPSNNQNRIGWTQYIANQLPAIGIGISTVNITSDAFNRIFSNVGNSDVPLYDQGGYDAITVGYFHGDLTLEYRFSTEGLCDADFPYSCSNFINLRDPLIDSLSIEYEKASNKEDKIYFLLEIQNELYAKYPIIPLLYPEYQILTKQDLIGIDPNSYEKAIQPWHRIHYADWIDPSKKDNNDSGKFPVVETVTIMSAVGLLSAIAIYQWRKSS